MHDPSTRLVAASLDRRLGQRVCVICVQINTISASYAFRILR